VPALAKKVLVMFATHQSFLEPPTTGVVPVGGAGTGAGATGATAAAGAGAAAYRETVYAKAMGSYL
jgi:hypothetical protein